MPRGDSLFLPCKTNEPSALEREKRKKKDEKWLCGLGPTEMQVGVFSLPNDSANESISTAAKLTFSLANAAAEVLSLLFKKAIFKGLFL